MKWSDLKEVIGGAAPLLGTLIGGPAGGAVGSLISGSLGVEATPQAVASAIQSNPDAHLKLRELQENNQAQLEQMHIQAETKNLSEINRTMRAELSHDGIYKSGWRPLIGYVVAISFLGLMSSLIYSIFKRPDTASSVVESATVIISLMLGVLGINIRSRSGDKKAMLGQQTPTLLQQIFKN